MLYYSSNDDEKINNILEGLVFSNYTRCYAETKKVNNDIVKQMKPCSWRNAYIDSSTSVYSMVINVQNRGCIKFLIRRQLHPHVEAAERRIEKTIERAGNVGPQVGTFGQNWKIK